MENFNYNTNPILDEKNISSNPLLIYGHNLSSINKYNINSDLYNLHTNKGQIYKNMKRNIIVKDYKKYECGDREFFSFVKNYIDRRNRNIRNLNDLFNISKSSQYEIHENTYYNKNSITKINENFQHKLNYIKLTQRYTRRFLSNLQLKDRVVSENEMNYKHRMVIRIQKTFRNFLLSKNIKIILLTKIILNRRLENIKKIKLFLTSIKIKTDSKKRIIIHKIIQIRREKITRIQNTWRNYNVRNKFERIKVKEATSYILTYPFVAKSVKCVIYNSELNEYIYQFEYCKLRKIYILYIDSKDFKHGKYRVKLLVDGLSTCDGRYPHIEFSDGHYYNIIDFCIKNKSIIYSGAKKNQLHMTTKGSSGLLSYDHFDESYNIQIEYSFSNQSVMSNNSSLYSNSYLVELRKQISTCEIDMDLKENLENSEPISYLQILKNSLEKEDEWI